MGKTTLLAVNVAKKDLDLMLAAEFRLTEMQIGTPHTKAFLTTRWGRAVDSASYRVIFLLAFLVLEYSSLYFLFAPLEHSIKLQSVDGAPNWVNAVYFSIITFTSLGYGDLVPLGFGKLIAGAVVLFGLALVALLIGKAASERQFSLSLLLYTSDSQRRLIGYCYDFRRLSEEVDRSVGRGGGRRLQAAIMHLRDLVEVVSKYVTFHAHQARLAHFGNDSALKALYVDMLASQKTLCAAFKSPLVDETDGDRCIRSVVKIANITSLLTMFQQNSERGVRAKVDAYPAELIAMKKVVAELEQWACRHRSQWLLAKVLPLTPPVRVEKWSNDIYATISVQLGISKTLAKASIDELVAQSRVPRKSFPSPDQLIELKANEYEKQFLDRLNSRAMDLQRQKLNGGPVSSRLSRLADFIVELERNESKGVIISSLRDTERTWRKLRQLEWTQLLLLEICHSPAFHAGEKAQAEALAYEVSQLAHVIFICSIGLKPASPMASLLRAFNYTGGMGNARHKDQVNRMKRSRPRMSLQELFSLSSRS